MKINSITLTNTTKNNNIKSNKNIHEQQTNPLTNASDYGKNMPSTQNYLSSINFTGGYSINLKKTIEGLDNLAEKIPNLYPPKVRELATNVIEQGNNAQETLIDIHKRAYSELKECFSLDEAKIKFPEFENVVEDNQATFREGTLFDKIKKGELEHFDSEEDVSLQLLKLYWGDGFSINDLKKYTDGTDLYHTMKKLQIPTVDKNYGHVLKFSDVEYNERLTKQMTENRMMSIERKLQEADGEPIFIKRGPLSEDHKKHISESLIKYYQENPEKLLEMSERQKEFYRNNPEQAEVFSRVMKKAWGYHGAEPIKKAMSSFMKGKGFKDFSSAETQKPLDLSKEKSSSLKAFWDLNRKYKAKMSENIRGAWKKVKEENETFYELDTTPMKYKEKFNGWLEERGLDPDDYEMVIDYYPHQPELTRKSYERIEKTNPLSMKFIDDYPGNESQKLADTYLLAIFKTYEHIDNLYKKTKSPNTKELIENLKFSTILLGQKGAEDVQVIQKVFTLMLELVADSHSPKILDKMYENLDDAYDFVERHNIDTHNGMNARLEELSQQFVRGKKAHR
ncbi:MAG: hypothetical protein R3Y28_01560 [Candidatus Gastranaerophilales bacterium]